jgi:hypothetical protein
MFTLVVSATVAAAWRAAVFADTSAFPDTALWKSLIVAASCVPL